VFKVTHRELSVRFTDLPLLDEKKSAGRKEVRVRADKSASVRAKGSLSVRATGR